MNRADALNDAIEAILSGRGPMPADVLDELRPLLAEGRSLLRHRMGDGSPSPTFLLGLEAQLVTDLRLQAPVARRRPWRAAGAVVVAAVGLLAAVLLGPASELLPARVTEPVHRAWNAVTLVASPSPDARIRRLLAQGWRHLKAAEDAGRSVPAPPALARALDAAIGRYRLALAAAADAALDARIRSQAEAEVQLVIARLARQAHGRPEDDRAIWVGARLTLRRLLVADARVVHLLPSPRQAPSDDARVLLPPAAQPAPPLASQTALPTDAVTPTVPTAVPTRESWPAETSVAPTASQTAPAAPSPVPATAERARPPATATLPATTPTEPPDPPARAVTPTQDRWPTATPRSIDPGMPTLEGSPQPSLPPPSEPPPLAP